MGGIQQPSTLSIIPVLTAINTLIIELRQTKCRAVLLGLRAETTALQCRISTKLLIICVITSIRMNICIKSNIVSFSSEETMKLI